LQIASAVKHLHDHNVAHLDIKPNNVLLDSNFNAKLSDFGVAQLMGSKVEHITPKIGTKNYMAPEISNTKKDHGYNPFSADVYSLGVLFHVLLKGELPTNSTASQSETSLQSHSSLENVRK